MDERTYNLIGPDYPGNRADDLKNPGLWWMIGFLFVVSFLGLFSLVPLRKVTAGFDINDGYLHLGIKAVIHAADEFDFVLKYSPF